MSRFEYVDNVQAAETGSGGNHVIGHVSAPKSSSFFSDYGMDSGFHKKTSPSSKVQVSLMTYNLLTNEEQNEIIVITFTIITIIIIIITALICVDGIIIIIIVLLIS